MPKSPILYREVFFDKLRDGTLRDLEWALVNTSRGAMVESRPVMGLSYGKVVNVDPYDTSYNKRSQMDENKFYSLTGTGGQQLPKVFNNTQP